MPVLTKALALLALSIPLASATQTDIPAVTHPEIVKVVCDHAMGSAFKVGPRVLLSVAHVTSQGGCKIDGEPVKVIHQKGDFVILRSDRVSARWLKVDCGGFVRGRKYTARGYARGLDTLTDVDLDGTGYSQGQFAFLTGIFTVVPGQSGGAVIDDRTGRVVGTVNVYRSDIGVSGSVALKDTVVCNA